MGAIRHGVRSVLTVVLAIAAAVVVPAQTRAQDPPLTANDFSIDVFTGPALSSSRIVGMGGAYAGIGDGIDGVPLNPASFAARTLYELSSFEWELSFGFLLPGAFSKNDFDNNGQTGFTTSNFLFVTAGLRLQVNRVGFGTLLRSQGYSFVDGAGAVDVSLFVVNTGFGYQLFEGQLVLGAGLRAATLNIHTSNGTSASLVELIGSGPEVGALWRPAGRPFRVGLSARTAVLSIPNGAPGTADASGVVKAGDLVLPHDVHMPWEVGLGVAVQIGNRPLNLAWHDPSEADERLETRMLTARALRTRAQVEREMARDRALGRPAPVDDPRSGGVAARGPTDPAWLQAEQVRRESEDAQLEAALDADDEEIKRLSRLYLLISAELLMTGPTEDGVGLEGFLSQTRERSGQSLSVGARLGLEGEPWPGHIKLRAGTYFEPSRFDGVGYRVHGTAGIDVKLFTWDVFGLFDDFDIRVNAAMDIASRYFDWGVGIGIWH